MKILCTLSGGSDSAYAAFVAKKAWPEAEFHSLFVDYGQPEVGPELYASVTVHNKLGFPAWSWSDVRIQWLYAFDRGHRDDLNSLYVPHRNLVIASIAAAYADKIGAEKVVVGNKSFEKTEGDFLTYDGNLKFYKALQAVVQMIQVREPVLEIVPALSQLTQKKLTRQDVYFNLWAEGFRYEDTFSCWFGTAMECGACKNCVEKKSLWEKWLTSHGVKSASSD